MLPGRLEYSGGWSDGRNPSETRYISGSIVDVVSWDVRDGAMDILATMSAGIPAYFGSCVGAGRCGSELRSTECTLSMDIGVVLRGLISLLSKRAI